RDLVKIACLNLAGGKGGRLIAAQCFLFFLLRVVQKLAGIGNDLRQTAGQKLVTEPAEIVIPSQGRSKPSRGASVWIEHELHILKMAFSCALSGLNQHFRGVAIGGGAKLAEGGKEMVV